MKAAGYGNGRPGYVVDHIVPLSCESPDMPSNMQGQTAAQARLRDRVERTGY